MAKRFPLQTLLDLAQDSSDAAAAHLGVVNGHDRDMQKRLQLLLDYRSEYTERLASMTRTGTHSMGLRNFREFMDKIDLAIEQQRQLVAAAKAEVETGKLHWHKEQRKLKSFNTLSQRHRTTVLKGEARQEQKDQDDFALRGYLGRRTSVG